MASPGCGAPTAPSSAFCPSRASGAASARAVAGGGWPSAPPISSTRCCDSAGAPVGPDAAVSPSLPAGVGPLLARRHLEPADDTTPPDPLADSSPVLAGLASASVQGRVALGPRAGARVRRLGGEPNLGHVPSRGPRQAQLDGFDLHANLWVPPNDRARLEQLGRYLLRPPHARWRSQVVRYGRPHPESTARHVDANPRAAGTPGAWTWAALLHRVLDLDVLAYPRCGGRLRVLATIQDPRAVQAILAPSKRPLRSHRRGRPVRVGRRCPSGGGISPSYAPLASRASPARQGRRR